MSQRPRPPIFISHAGADDSFVADLRNNLEALGLPVWVDSRGLRGGDKLAPEIVKAIDAAPAFIMVLSLDTVNSPWVRAEVKLALKVEKRRKEHGYRVIPLLRPGITPRALGTWFKEEPVAVSIQLGCAGLADAMPAILAALGERLPEDQQPAVQPDAKPLDELILTLIDPKVDANNGVRCIIATATLLYEPASPATRRIESRRFTLRAPLGRIEADDLRWYLESYAVWPAGVFQERADRIEKHLQKWGRDLFQAAVGSESARVALNAWQSTVGTERRFSIQVDSDLPEGAPANAQAETRAVAAEWLALPWELLHDGHGWLFQGRHPVRVRRRLPNREPKSALVTALPLRILLVSPRPERNAQGDPISYIDHRITAQPLVDAIENLAELVQLTILSPPTYAALDQALQIAADRGNPFDVIHFDGHGVYNQELGFGALCFEDPSDADKPEGRAVELVDAQKLAGLFRAHRVQLVFLEACQSAQAEKDPTGSVAAGLLEQGVVSVVAMSHSVLVETARRFVEAFYSELCNGARVGRAMLAGQRALFADPQRGKVMGAGALRIQDWFVPVLYQEKQDPQLVTRIPAPAVQHLDAKKRTLSLGALPAEPSHRFQGRSRELLWLERLLVGEHGQSWVVVRGTGGIGKTTLVNELARWLVRSRRFERAAFVSLNHYRDARAILDTLGHQLLPEGQGYSVAQFPNLEKSLQPVERALRDQSTIVVLDNCESVLPSLYTEDENLPAILKLFQQLLTASPHTRLIMTTREPLPTPFDCPMRQRELGALDLPDAVALVSRVMKQHGWMPFSDDAGRVPEDIDHLVEAVRCHARALVLLAREVASAGIQATTADLRALMVEMERRHPGDRENSLYASVALSLRRLSLPLREHVQSLAVCQGGVQWGVLQTLTGLGEDDVWKLTRELIDVGLGEDMGDGHLRLDPALPPFLLGDMTTEHVELLRMGWAEAMSGLTAFLYKQRFNDTRLAARLTLLELPNLLAMLIWLKDRWSPERVVTLADSVETLVSRLGRPKVLKQAILIREQAARKLDEAGGWQHAQVVAAFAHIDRLIERGELQVARTAAQQLLGRCLANGDAAFPEAAFDTAGAHFRLGRVLQRSGDAEAALEPFRVAQRWFQQTEEGDAAAKLMFDAATTESADCLRDLGRLDEAAVAYEERIRSAGSKGDERGIAVTKGQLGTIRLLQRRYADALKAHLEALDTFTALGEPISVASAWHQIGVAHQESGQLELAEKAYCQSLAIRVRESDLAGEASSLNQLGNVYQIMDKLGDAANFYRQCAVKYVQLGDLAREGAVRGNLARTLVKLRQYGEARQELERAIECNKPFEHAVQHWVAWAILEQLESATGDAGAALLARHQAIQSYLAYRRAGGLSHSPRAQLFALVVQAFEQNQAPAAVRSLSELFTNPNAHPLLKVLISKLQAILVGDRSSTLAVAPDLTYIDTAELHLLLDLTSVS